MFNTVVAERNVQGTFVLAEALPWDGEPGLEAAVSGGDDVFGPDGATIRGGCGEGDADCATGEGGGPEGLEAALKVGVELAEANTGSEGCIPKKGVDTCGCECRWVCCCCRR